MGGAARGERATRRATGRGRMSATPESGFLADMAERRVDNAARLIYADWLEDNGDPDRAEFIRLQCGPRRDDPTAKGRADELLKAHRKKWEAPFQALDGEIKFERGFPHVLQVDIGVL